jgi:hypothetical protein
MRRRARSPRSIPGRGDAAVETKLRPNAWLWTLAALAGLAWGLIALVFASVGPSQFVPRLFYSYHIEHFAAFYVLTLLASSGLPRAPLRQVAPPLVLMAVLLATVRLLIPRHRMANAEDLAADIAGIAAAVAPILVGRFRQVVAERRPPASTTTTSPG